MFEVENVSESEVERVVHGSIESIMSVVRDIADVTLEDFSNLVNSSGCSILLPEVFLDVRDSINSDTVEVEVLNNIFDPCKQGLSHKRVILIQVWEISKAAVLYLILIVPVVDLALSVVVRRLIEGCNKLILLINPCYVVGNDVQHYPDSLLVSSIDHVFKTLLVSKVRVNLVPIECAVSMIVVSIVLWDRRDPNSIESHSLDVIELVLDSLEGTTAVLSEVSTTISSAIIFPESISQELIDSP